MIWETYDSWCDRLNDRLDDDGVALKGGCMDECFDDVTGDAEPSVLGEELEDGLAAVAAGERKAVVGRLIPLLPEMEQSELALSVLERVDSDLAVIAVYNLLCRLPQEAVAMIGKQAIELLARSFAATGSAETSRLLAYTMRELAPQTFGAVFGTPIADEQMLVRSGGVAVAPLMSPGKVGVAEMGEVDA